MASSRLQYDYYLLKHVLFCFLYIQKSGLKISIDAPKFLSSSFGVSDDEAVRRSRSSLLQLMHDHHQSSHALGQQTEKAKKDALRCATRVSDILVDAVNGDVQESFINEKRIELEIRAFAATVSRYSNATDQWLAASQSINSALKEIGDFENWMKIMDYDCRSVNADIQNIYQA